MRASPRTRVGVFILTLTAAVALLGTATPSAAATAGTMSAESCTFAIRATNNYSFDVFVDLYDSTVRNHAVVAKLFSIVQLKIQNERIPTGGKMDRRYTASGRCAAKRTWTFQVRKGSRSKQQLVVKMTSGTSSTSRTVDLGKASTW